MAAKKKAAKPKGIVNDIAGGVGKALESNSITSSLVRDIKAFQSGGVKGVVKAAAKDAAFAAAGLGIAKGGSQVAGVVGRAAGKSIGGKVSDSYYDEAVRNLGKISQGGKVFKTNTPMGPSLGSTKIMTAGQRGAAQAGLSQIASNQADRAGSIVANEINALVSGAIRATSKGAGALSYNAGKAKTTPKPKAKSKARKNVR
jgi:hypothetical protein